MEKLLDTSGVLPKSFDVLVKGFWFFSQTWADHLIEIIPSGRTERFLNFGSKFLEETPILLCLAFRSSFISAMFLSDFTFNFPCDVGCVEPCTTHLTGDMLFFQVKQFRFQGFPVLING